MQTNTAHNMQKVTKHAPPGGHIAFRNEDGLLHNEEGPAFIWTDGTEDFWLNGEMFSKEDFDVAIRDLHNSIQGETKV